MSVGLPSDEVAEDYKNSLEDLTMNSRYEISNLTVIAKENTEHAMAISRVLENHIRNAPPDRKLPALYVLDSVVKNVGTPYTLFLGRNLYQTFMDAYSLVNSQIRKKLDEMLKTWKEPVPGSLETRPVFPVEITRPIENALIKAKTMAVQQQQQQARGQLEMFNRNRSMATPNGSFRNTPTPPQNNARYPPPNPSGFVQHYPSHLTGAPNGHHQILRPSASPYPQYASPQPTPSQFQPPFQQPSSYPQLQPPDNIGSLHRDIENLIRIARAEFAANPFETAIQTRLKALLDLQSILESQQLPPDQIQLIRDQVAQLSPPPRPSSVAPSQNAPPPVLAAVPPPQSSGVQQPPDLQALLSSNALADLLASAARAQQTPNIPPNAAIPMQQRQAQTPQPSNPPISAPPSGESSLLAQLRASGLLPYPGNTPAAGSVPPPPPQFPSSLPTPNMQNPLVLPSGMSRPAQTEVRNDVQLTSASVKIPRPHLIDMLYGARPNQCSTCGRRFLASEEDRKRKARHLDWHFRTNQRLADSARRGQSRSWYVDEMEWIRSKDNVEDDANDGPAGSDASKASAATAAAKNDPKTKYIPVPNDPILSNAPCPICQERFETVFNDEAQDFVWMDAIKIGGRVFHASCHAEMKKDGGSTPLRTSTPDSVLGKRKAEVSG
ncbi:MAG: mRNA cleavage factor complex component Pcf11 [Lasallia pustulata]|uniref:mRNA cleavage factor complex component Pcf11 n=1 Tax=Lasallia pustulata TaxID=136370 RepID=A0A5M8PJN2_9LECA|nr:MAG: mRNA cleavage factor complex component Pcf11 [Lasallia pustulata]